MSKKVVEKQIEVSQLAKELGRTSREILVYLKDQGEDVTLRSYRKKLTPKWQDQIREHFSDGEKTPDKSNKKKKAVSKKSLSGAQKNEKKPNTKLDLEEKRTIEISKEKEDKISTKIDAQEEKKKSTSSKEPEKPKKYAPITIISPIGHKLKPKVKSPVSIPGNVNMKSSSSGSEKVSTLSQSRETKSHKGDVPFSKETSNLEGDAPLVQKEDRRLSGPRKKDRRFEKHYREERHEKHYKDFKKRPLPPQKPQLPQSVEIEVPTTVKELSNVTGIKANELISVFMKNGILRRINDPITEEDLLFIEEEFKIEIKVKEQETAEDKLEKLLMEDPPETQKLKPPVVTFVGHVDHGKTSLLDYIRKTKVQAGEVGGITQHIGAYTVKRKGKKITFIDTPGHEAFTEMRARGVNVTDIVVLVVAADDGVMPQTKEAISHAKAAKVPIIVAINKIDKPEADPERVRRELAEQELLWDQWGGDTIMVEVSAVTGQGVEDLMESLLDLADLYEFKANPDRPGVGTIIEAKLSEHRGPIATVILQRGNLKVGDIVLCGVTFGRIRAMYNDQGVEVHKCLPGEAVEIIGLEEVPLAGDQLVVMEDLSLARSIANQRKDKHRATQRMNRARVTLENLYSQIDQGEVKEVALIIKADTQGSIEALRDKLKEIQHDEVKINIIHTGVGGINISDVQLADASNAIIIGFYVTADTEAVSLAQERNVEIRTYQVIYQVVDEVKAALEGMLEPELKEVETARIEVREVFKIKSGTIAGCYVKQGKVERSNKIRVVRNNVVLYDSSIESLKRFKDDVKEVKEGFECGIKIQNFNDIKVGDELIAYRVEKVARTL